jgi:hypothetical protein
MRDRDDANDIRSPTKYEGVWKAAQWNSTMNWVDLFAEGRQLDKYARNALDFKDEVISESAELSLIMGCGVKQLLFCGGKNSTFIG